MDGAAAFAVALVLAVLVAALVGTPEGKRRRRSATVKRKGCHFCAGGEDCPCANMVALTSDHSDDDRHWRA